LDNHEAKGRSQAKGYIAQLTRKADMAGTNTNLPPFTEILGSDIMRGS